MTYAENPRCFLKDLRPSGTMEVTRPIPGFVEDRSYRLKAEGRSRVYFPAIKAMVERGWYLKPGSRSKGYPLLVVGAGDGADYLKADHHISAALGCESDRSKFFPRGKRLVSLAEYNILQDPYLATHLKAGDIDIVPDDGVHYLQDLKQKIEAGILPLFDGRFQSFLPQSKSTATSLADSFSPSHEYDSNKELYEPYKEHWDDFGLTLYRAVLGELRPIVTPRTEALVVMSNRVPDDIISDMLHTSGWEIAEAVNTKTVRHDIDTDISWMVGAFEDDGNRFQDIDGAKLSVEEAARRVTLLMDIARKKAELVITSAEYKKTVSDRQKMNIVKKAIAGCQKDLDVYEEMSAYRLVPLKQAA